MSEMETNISKNSAVIPSLTQSNQASLLMFGPMWPAKLIPSAEVRRIRLNTLAFQLVHALYKFAEVDLGKKKLLVFNCLARRFQFSFEPLCDIDAANGKNDITDH